MINFFANPSPDYHDVMDIYDNLPPDTDVNIQIYDNPKLYFNGMYTPYCILVRKPSLQATPKATAAARDQTEKFLSRYVERHFSRFVISFNNNFGNDVIIKLLL